MDLGWSNDGDFMGGSLCDAVESKFGGKQWQCDWGGFVHMGIFFDG